MPWIIGIDEVGRGALAGPVVVAAAAVPRGRPPGSIALGPLKDSKKLSERQREAWLAYCAARGDIYFAVARVYPRQIEKRNISRAANLAAERAVRRLYGARRIQGMKPPGRGMRICLDGGLFLGNGAWRSAGETIVGGDEKVAAIKLASIAAKVHRDRFMRRLAGRYPGYGFEAHKGYGTNAHREALRRRGPCPAHRLTFSGKSDIMGIFKGHGRRTNQASFKGQSRPQAFASRDEEAAAFRMQKLRRAEARAPRLSAVRGEVGKGRRTG